MLSIASCRPERRYGPADLQLAEELGRRVALALDNAHLYEVAQDAIQVRDRVLGVVAHDLRNPLNAILLNSDLLKRRATEPERRSQKQFDGIRKAALRMNRLIQDLLDVMRLESGHLAIERQPVAVGELVAEAIEAAQQAAADASIDLRLDVADEDSPSARRPGPAASGARQPARQRHQVHRARAAGSPWASRRRAARRCSG